MNPIWYGIILMLIQLGIFLLVLDFLDNRQKPAEEHGHENHH